MKGDGGTYPLDHSSLLISNPQTRKLSCFLVVVLAKQRTVSRLTLSTHIRKSSLSSLIQEPTILPRSQQVTGHHPTQ